MFIPHQKVAPTSPQTPSDGAKHSISTAKVLVTCTNVAVTEKKNILNGHVQQVYCIKIETILKVCYSIYVYKKYVIFFQISINKYKNIVSLK